MPERIMIAYVLIAAATISLIAIGFILNRRRKDERRRRRRGG